MSEIKDWLVLNQDVKSGEMYLLMDCCFSELALGKNPTNRVGLVQRGLHHYLIKM